MSLIDWLKHPEARAINDLDCEETVSAHAQIIKSKGFLRRLYSEFYNQISTGGGYDDRGMFVEVGSGGGFIKEVMPDIVTSDVVPHDGVDEVFPAESMPFDDESVNGIFILNCFHHFSEPALVLKEFERVLVNGGSVVMIEPANTWWGRLIYTHLHHEPFDPSGGWSLPTSGRLSGANGALPWIVFVRDREAFSKLFRSLAIDSVIYHTPFSYLISGGLTWRQLVPTWGYPLIRTVERVLGPVSGWLGMFMTIVIKKREPDPQPPRDTRKCNR